MPWWGWIVVGAALLAAEVAVPADFYLAVLGIAALITGLLTTVGLEIPIWGQWLLFAGLSVVALVAIRRRVADRFRFEGGDPRVGDSLVGKSVVVRGAMAPGETGQAELRGSVWSVRNTGDEVLEKGDRAVVQEVEGLLLHVRSES